MMPRPASAKLKTSTTTTLMKLMVRWTQGLSVESRLPPVHPIAGVADKMRFNYVSRNGYNAAVT
ncbi:hypothetical protein CCACVL1_17492 [Corchorus capsularis]|uniref:Uncharacterized protein n=1 Tax=Corchorus capsularis TaxID=210143 RepID=A0A1R3HRK3_COCAP|nr:hypothetical protein CCACVL1_17492 [Corchorus capsularis]